MTTATKPTCELCGEPLPEGEEMFKFHGYSSGCPKPSLTKSVPIMNDRHPSHVTRISDASSFDEVCINCGATDITGGGWGALANPCPKASITQQTMTDAEKLREIANDIQKHVGDTTLKSLMTFHLLRIADLLDSIPPEVLKALADGMKTAVSTALLRNIAKQKLSIEVDEEARTFVDFQEGYDCVVKLVRAMLAAAPEKPE